MKKFWIIGGIIIGFLAFSLVGNVLPVMAFESPAAIITDQATTDNTGQSAAKAAQLARKQALEEQKAVLLEKKEAFTAAHCAIIGKKVQIKIMKYNVNLGKRQTFHQKFANRVENFIRKIDTTGVDTTKLKADLVILKEKIAKYNTDKAAYITSLKETQLYACGKSEGEFRSHLLDSREALNTVKLSAEDVKTYYSDTIRPDIMALKKEIKATSSTTIPTTSTNPE